MPGGSRPGERRGGRKKGTPNKATTERRAIIERVTAMGLTPLDVMTEAYLRARELAVKTDTAAKKARKPEDKAALRAEADTRFAAAAELASKAAPYVHPKLQALQSNVNLTGRLTLEALVTQAMEIAANRNEQAALEDDSEPVKLIDVVPR